MSKYANKRLHTRNRGRFSKPVARDYGINGFCPKCRHLIVQYNLNPIDVQFVDPRKFVWRCAHCEPFTEEEQAILDRRAEIYSQREQEQSRRFMQALLDIAEGDDA
jgi:hypothetical protein